MDASVLIDALTDPGTRGDLARAALASASPQEPLSAPGILGHEVLAALRAVAARPSASFTLADVEPALHEAEGYGIHIQGTPWSDVRRAWELSEHSLRDTDALYVATAERLQVPLLTADTKIASTGAPIHATILTVSAPS